LTSRDNVRDSRYNNKIIQTTKK